MEKFSIYVPRLLPQKDYFVPGHRACIGCAEALAVRLVAKAAGRETIISNATGCMEIVASPFPTTSWSLPWIHTLFENTAAVASGIESALKILNKKGRLSKKPTVLAQGGDGATVDIGLQALSGAWERGHDFVYVCYDNEAYMNTGIQRSSATPFGASTTTSPAGKLSIGQTRWKKNMPAIAVAHDIPYVATACPSYPFDLMDKVKKAMAIEGPAYLHILSACPTGWRFPGDLSIRMGRLAVETGVFPIYEVENGRYKLNINLPKLRPVRDYLAPQGRFRHLPNEEVDRIQEGVDREYQKIIKKLEA
ncbi:pyruvate synthase subunit PorB [Chloroflexota bacterium]